MRNVPKYPKYQKQNLYGIIVSEVLYLCYQGWMGKDYQEGGYENLDPHMQKKASVQILDACQAMCSQSKFCPV